VKLALSLLVVLLFAMKTAFLAAALVGAGYTAALDADGWRKQSIYQVLTDRFARTDGSTTAACNTSDRVYCGGTYQGIINHLDYIQGMGFTAVCASHDSSATILTSHMG
jgi:alpha-amylase